MLSISVADVCVIPVGFVMTDTTPALIKMLKQICNVFIFISF